MDQRRPIPLKRRIQTAAQVSTRPVGIHMGQQVEKSCSLESQQAHTFEVIIGKPQSSSGLCVMQGLTVPHVNLPASACIHQHHLSNKLNMGRVQKHVSTDVKP